MQIIDRKSAEFVAFLMFIGGLPLLGFIIFFLKMDFSSGGSTSGATGLGFMALFAWATAALSLKTR